MSNDLDPIKNYFKNDRFAASNGMRIVEHALRFRQGEPEDRETTPE